MDTKEKKLVTVLGLTFSETEGSEIEHLSKIGEQKTLKFAEKLEILAKNQFDFKDEHICGRPRILAPRQRKYWETAGLIRRTLDIKDRIQKAPVLGRNFAPKYSDSYDNLVTTLKLLGRFWDVSNQLIIVTKKSFFLALSEHKLGDKELKEQFNVKIYTPDEVINESFGIVLEDVSEPKTTP